MCFISLFRVLKRSPSWTFCEGKKYIFSKQLLWRVFKTLERLDPCVCRHVRYVFTLKSIWQKISFKRQTRERKWESCPQPADYVQGSYSKYNTNPNHAQKKTRSKKNFQKIDLPWFPIHLKKNTVQPPKKKTPSTTERISPPDESFQRIGCSVLGFILVIFWKGVYNMYISGPSTLGALHGSVRGCEFTIPWGLIGSLWKVQVYISWNSSRPNQTGWSQKDDPC